MAVATDRATRSLMTVGHDSGDAAPADAALASAGSANAGAHRPRWVVPTAIVLVVLLVGALVATIWFGIKVSQGFGVEQGRSNAVSAAKDVAANLTTYDVGSLDNDTKRLLDGATPAYAGSFQSGKSGFVSRVQNGQVRSTGEVTEAGMLSYDPTTDTAHVLVSVRAQITSKESPVAEARDYRLDVTMIDQGDWLVDQVEFVS